MGEIDAGVACGGGRMADWFGRRHHLQEDQNQIAGQELHMSELNDGHSMSTCNGNSE
jgi:hypothetical protein